MRRTLLTFILFSALPVVASAASYMNVSSVSSANSGGNHVGSGGAVTTGDSYSAVSVQATANGNSMYYDGNSTSTGGGTTYVHVETNSNGVVHDETIKGVIPVDRNINVSVSTSSSSNTGGVHIQVSLPKGIAHIISSLHGLSSSSNSTSSLHSFAHATSSVQFDFGTQFRNFMTHFFSFLGFQW